jgi:hypothetical protein
MGGSGYFGSYCPECGHTGGKFLDKLNKKKLKKYQKKFTKVL